MCGRAGWPSVALELLREEILQTTVGSHPSWCAWGAQGWAQPPQLCTHLWGPQRGGRWGWVLGSHLGLTPHLSLARLPSAVQSESLPGSGNHSCQLPLCRKVINASGIIRCVTRRLGASAAPGGDACPAPPLCPPGSGWERTARCHHPLGPSWPHWGHGPMGARCRQRCWQLPGRFSPKGRVLPHCSVLVLPRVAPARGSVGTRSVPPPLVLVCVLLPWLEMFSVVGSDLVPPAQGAGRRAGNNSVPKKPHRGCSPAPPRVNLFI